MSSIILDIQKKALKSDSDVKELLRESLLVAKKLDIKDFEQWLELELNGYASREAIPKYRRFRGILEGKNHNNHWEEINLENQDNYIFVKPGVAFSIPTIETIINNKREKIGYNLSPMQKKKIGEGLLEEDKKYYDFRLYFQKHQFINVLDQVKNILMDWTIKLEKEGIKGYRLTFSDEEKEKAVKQNFVVNNFYREAQGLQFQQDTQNSTQIQTNDIDIKNVRNFVDSVEENLTKIDELKSDSKESIEAELDEIKRELEEEPNPTLVRGSLNSIKTILEGATGSVIAQGLLYQLANSGLI